MDFIVGKIKSITLKVWKIKSRKEILDVVRPLQDSCCR